LGYASLIFYMLLVPLYYFRKLRAASKVSAYFDGNKLCIGQELWSVEFSEKCVPLIFACLCTKSCFV